MVPKSIGVDKNANSRAPSIVKTFCLYTPPGATNRRVGNDGPRSALRSPPLFRTAGLHAVAVGEALRNDGLDVWYQPKIDLKRKCLAGAEALARIRHPQEGMLWPDSFLPGLDEDSLAQLTEHVLLATLRNWTAFADAGFNLHLAINIPASVLSTLPICRLVSENRPGAEEWPGLILEISEDQIVRDIALAQNIAAELKACGVSLAIDNFGAGYSSFSSLRTVPFAELKLAGQFVKGCATDANNAAICQTAIDLAHRFGSMAVAEGVESMADLQALVAMGCDFGQGDWWRRRCRASASSNCCANA